MPVIQIRDTVTDLRPRNGVRPSVDSPTTAGQESAHRPSLLRNVGQGAGDSHDSSGLDRRPRRQTRLPAKFKDYVMDEIG